MNFQYRLTRILAALAGAVALPLAPWLRRHYPAPEVVRHALPSPQGRGGPGPLRMVFLSDLHAGPTMTWPYLENIVSRCNALAPDIVALGGDLISRKPGVVERLAELLCRLEAPLGKFAVRGNHDFSARGQLRPALAGAGIRLLVNEGLRLSRGDRGLWLCGVDDIGLGRPDLGAALSGRRDGEFTLLLAHNPDFIARVPAGAVDLMLSGHTHGGQIKLFGRAIVSNSVFGMRYLEGWNRDGPCPVYTSRGVGAIRVPLRIGSKPEITVIDFA